MATKTVYNMGGVSVSYVGDVNLKEMHKRVRNLKPALAKINEMLESSTTYTRPDRLSGGPKIGPIYNDPGYPTSQRRVRMVRNKLTLTHKRPYHPYPTEAAIDQFAEHITKHILEDTGEGDE
jgi:hypothetical protein